MARQSLLVALSFGLAVAGCGNHYDQTASLPYVTRAETTQYVMMPKHSCIEFGFTTGTAAYDNCANGHVYAYSLLGIETRSEIAARHYREAAYLPPQR